jgi:glycosyltransferase involved in cell wall biosynthesis
LIIFCNKLIVLEQHFAEVLNKKYKSEKVVFIPHGVDTKLRLIDKTIAKRKLGLPQDQLMLMSFGFLKWYKGSDILAEKFFRFVKRYPHEKVLLVFAGGESQAHKKVPNYRQFVNKIKQIAEKTKKVIVTGFLPREEMIKYLSAADVLLFPYRTFISSSGPLSLAFSFKKPVWLSNKLKPYFKSVDIKKALKLGGVNQSGMLFSLAGNGLDNKILNWNRGQTEFESQKFSELMSNSRNWKKIGRQYLAVLK